MAAPPAKMLSPASRHGFFKTLPREIREKIYDLLYDKVLYLSLVGAPTVSVQFPYVQLHLVSGQFKHGYDERVAKSEHLATLSISDRGIFLSATISCPALYTRTTNMKINLWTCHSDHGGPNAPCDSIERLCGHATWISDLVDRLPYLRSICICLSITYEQCMDEALRSLQCLADMPKVIEVEVKHTGWARRGRVNVEPSDIPALATSTKERGLVLHHAAIKQCRESEVLQW